MARKIEYLEAAVQDAEAAARWYAGHSAVAARGFTDEIEAAEAASAGRPEAWPRFGHGTRRYLLRRFPFSVIYRVESSRVLVIAVAHGRRRPGYWKPRLSIPG